MVSRPTPRLLLCLVSLCQAGVCSAQDNPRLPEAARRAVDYNADVRPLLEQHCFRCHGPDRKKSGLRLDHAAGRHAGGSLFGPAVLPGDPAGSPLVRLAAGLEPNLVMPPSNDEKPTLTETELGLLVAWIAQGASAPDDDQARPEETPLWSLQPLVEPKVPALPPGFQASNPIDAFLAVEMARAGLSAAPEADRPTLLRRLSYDLTGLPPTPDDIASFEADPAPDAYEKQVERLLASPRYGERWARHWLDVVHYGESNGFGMDRPRDHAWPYRDFVIESLNLDKPYARFVQEQLAADHLFPDEPALTPALGFAAAGPFNQSALVEQVDGTLCKQIALNLDRDDMVATVASTFLSLTVHCARCHDHKFDPIPSADYYRLQAVFSGVGRADRTYDPDPNTHRQRLALLDLQKRLDSGSPLPDFSAEQSDRLAQARAHWEQSIRASLSSWRVVTDSNAVATDGVALSPQPDGSYLATGPNPETTTYTLSFPAPLSPLTALRLELFPDHSLPANGPGRAPNGNLHLTDWRLTVLRADGTEQPLTFRGASADFDQQGWTISHAIDSDANTGWGIHPQEGKPHVAVAYLAEPLELAAGESLRVALVQEHGRQHTIGRFRLSVTDQPIASVPPVLPAELLLAIEHAPSTRTPEQAALLDRHFLSLDVQQRLAALGEPRRVWAISSNFPPRRNYKPPAPDKPIHILRRGDVTQPLAPVTPGALSCIKTLSPDFALDPSSPESARRASLALWITDPANPLTWRSIVNRVWLWHFGTALVDTPNDFGRLGSLPSHPALLDWLACRFRDNGGSLKDLHRLLVSSAAYRRASGPAPASDSDNRLLSRRNRQRLDAEQLRDTLLFLAGRLDSSLGGPSAIQFVLHDPNPEVSPGIDYASFDPDAPASSRRAVYRFLIRNVNDPLLEAFDAADPSLSTPRRNVTITPQQALALWNDKLVLRTCEHLAARLEREAHDLPSRIHLLCRMAWGRPPTTQEASTLAQHASRHGLPSACRIALNANDLLFLP